MSDSIKNTLDLNGIDSSATYEVTIKNFGEIDYQLDTIFEDVFSNDQIEYVLDGLQIGDVIESKDEVTFRITYKYKDGIVAQLEPRLNSELRFVFDEYIDISGYTKYYRRLVFDGTNYEDTGIALFSEENIDKDFEIHFEITDVGTNDTQATLMNAKDEKGSPWPGIAYRIYGANDYELSASNYLTLQKPKAPLATTKKVTIKRDNGILYIKINDGNFSRVLDMSSMSPTFDVPVTFGASLTGSGEPQRYFTGTLENVYIKLIEPEKYTIAYNSNGGIGTMENQKVRVNNTVALSENTFTRSGYAFSAWNTKADGTGQTYSEGQQVSNLGANGETVTLYAMWLQEFNYTVAYNSNGGIGSMESQIFQFGETKTIKSNEFTKSNNIFIKWNTKADGTGDDYIEGQSVKNLTQNSGDVITLYAIWMPLTYEYAGEYVFTGSNYIDTGLYLFNKHTINRDFEINFEIVSQTYGANQATIVNAKDETGSPWPGIAFRYYSNTEYELSASNYVSSQKPRFQISTTTKVSIKRENNILYVKINDGSYTSILDMSRIPSAFDVPVTFGASLNGSGKPQRYFKGTLRNMRVTIS